MSLAYEHLANPNQTRLAMVHGFAQNRRCWGPVVGYLTAAYDLRLIDAPGHGESGHDDADLVEAAALVTEVAGKAHYAGYSMGGRMVLSAAVHHPELVQSMVLIGATAGIRDEDERWARWIRDRALAAQVIEEGVDTFLDGWIRQPLFSGLSPEMQFRSERGDNRAEGMADSLRNCGTGNQSPVWDRLPELLVPTAVVVGEHDTKFRAYGEEMAKLIPSAELIVVPGAGHAPHLQAPEAVAAVISRMGGSQS